MRASPIPIGVRAVSGSCGVIPCSFVDSQAARRARIFARTAEYLAAAAEASTAQGTLDAADLARRHKLDADALAAWLDYLGIGAAGAVELNGHFTNKIANSAGYEFIKGWGRNDTPLLVGNSSDQHERIPGNMKPHSVRPRRRSARVISSCST